MDRNIWCAMDLLDANGDLLPYSDFCCKYDFDCNLREFKSLINVIPNTFIFLVKNMSLYSQSQYHLPTPSRN